MLQPAHVAVPPGAELERRVDVLLDVLEVVLVVERSAVAMGSAVVNIYDELELRIMFL